MAGNYIKTIHFATQLDESHRALQVHFDGALECFIEFDCGGRVEDDRYVVTEDLDIRSGHAQSRKTHIPGNGHQFVEHLWRVSSQLIKNLLPAEGEAHAEHNGQTDEKRWTLLEMMKHRHARHVRSRGRRNSSGLPWC